MTATKSPELFGGPFDGDLLSGRIAIAADTYERPVEQYAFGTTTYRRVAVYERKDGKLQFVLIREDVHQHQPPEGEKQ
jgi:hypothetical protein